jgi:hypothetical protein
MNTPNVVIKSKNVNSQLLFTQINDYVMDGILTGSVRWTDDIHRESFIEVVDDFLTELEASAKITQFNAICDLRNNSYADFEKGVAKITIRYKQINCLNVTEVVYYITD